MRGLEEPRRRRRRARPRGQAIDEPRAADLDAGSGRRISVHGRSAADGRPRSDGQRQDCASARGVGTRRARRASRARARMTSTRSLMARISGSSDEIMTMASPRPASSRMSAWISALAPTSTPCVGSSRIRTDGVGRQPARQRDLLLIASRQRPTAVSTDGVLMRKPLDVVGGQVTLGLPRRRDPSARHAAERREARVGGHADLRDRRRDAGGPRARTRAQRASPSAGDRIVTCAPVDADLARLGRSQAEHRLGQLGPARSDEAGHAEDLAARGPKATVGRHRPTRSTDRERSRATPPAAARPARSGHGGRARAPDHQPRSSLRGIRVRRESGCRPSAPSRMTVTRSAIAGTSSSRCEM